MNPPQKPMFNAPKTLAAVLIALVPLGLMQAQAAVYTMLGNDPTVPTAAQSSFTSAGRWSSGEAPSSGNTYVSSAFEIRTPQDNVNYVFGGDSLTLSNSGSLVYKGLTSTITINSLILDGGIYDNRAQNTTGTLAGNINVLSGGGSFYAASPIIAQVIASNISGVGAVQFRNTIPSPASNQIFRLTGNNAGLSGNLSVGSFITLDVRADRGLGSGNVSLASSSQLTLSLGSTNDYFGNTSLLTMSAGSLLNLNFIGVDTIGGISFDGGATFASEGVWGAIGSGAQFTSAFITGTGQLNVVAVPEPTVCILFAISAIGLVGLRVSGRKLARIG